MRLVKGWMSFGRSCRRGAFFGAAEPPPAPNGSLDSPRNDGPALAGVFLAELANAILDAGDEIPGAKRAQDQQTYTNMIKHGQTIGFGSWTVSGKIDGYPWL